MATVDEKVVQLRLDDSQFDKASDRTIKKLDELQNALKFDGAVGSFKEIDKAAKNVNISPLEKGVQAVTDKFSVLGTIADQALRRITTRAMDTGERMLKSLTTDNITKGWVKYGDKTAAVQTIMAATANQFKDTGEQMEFVEEQLGRLNWFTDETSYRFLDMVQNIGKFTANNISLEKSVTAMQGISTWAAISGANVNEAGRAMYNLSQAIAVGAVKLIDWKSIENANMSTAQFKQTVIETAEELGTLTKVGEGLWKTLGGKDVSVTNFNENLSEGWFSSDVLLSALDKYGGFSVRLNEILEETGILTSAMLGYIDEYTKGTLDMAAASRETGVSAAELSGYLEELSSEEYKLGKEAFEAAQATKTFQEAIDYIQEAVSSGWMQTFEYIFGNFTEAKTLWSELSEALYEVFVVSGELRNETLALWKDMGGRERLIDGLKTALKGLWRYVELVQTAFRNVFPRSTAEQLYEGTKRFQNLMHQLQLTDSAADNIRKTFEGVFTVFKTIGNVARAVIAGLDPILNLINQIVGGVLGISGGLGELTTQSLPEFFNPERLQKIYETVYMISSVIASIVRLIGALALSGGLGIAQFVSNIWATFKAGEGGIKGFFLAIFENFKILFNNLTSGESKITKILGNVKDLLFNIVDKFAEASGIKDGSIGGFFGSIVDGIKKSGFMDVVGAAVGLVGALLNAISSFLTGLMGHEASLQTVVTFFGEQINILYDWLIGNLSSMTAKDVADVMILILVAQFVSSMNKLTTKLTGSVGGFTAAINQLKTTIASWASGNTITEWSKSLSTFAKNTTWLQVAIAIGVMATAIAELSKLPTDQLGAAIATMAIAVGLLVLLEKAFESLLDKLNSSGGGGGNGPSQKAAAQKIRDVAIGIATLTAAMALLVKSFEGQDLDEYVPKLLAAGLSVVTMMSAMILFLAAIDQAKFDPRQMTKVGLTLNSIALAIALLVPSIAVLTLLDPGAVVGASLALAGLIAAFGALGNLIQNTNWAPILAMSAVIMSFGAAMLVVSLACAALIAVDWPSILQGAFAMGAMAMALAGIFAAFNAFGTLTNAGDMLGISAMLLSLSVGMIAIAQACIMLATVPLEELGNAGAVLVALVAAFAVMAGAAQLFSTGILAVSVALVSFGAACLMIAGSIAITVGAIKDIILIIFTLMAAGEVFGEDFGPMIEKAFDAFELIMVRILQLIRALAPEFAATLTSLILVIGNATTVGIIKLLPEITETLLQIGIALCDVIVRLGPTFLDALCALIDVLTDGVPKLLESLGKFIEELFAGLGVILNHAIKGLVRGVFNIFGIEFDKGVGNLASSIGGSMEEIITNKFGPDIKDTLLEQEGIWFDEMGKAMKGNGVDAIEVGADELIDACERCGVDMGDAMIEDGFKEEVGDHSPWDSIIEALRNAGLGFDVGTEAILGGIQTNGALAGNTFIEGVLQALSDGAIDVNDALAQITAMTNIVENTSPSHYRNLGGAKREMTEEWNTAVEEEEKDAENDMFDFGLGLGDSFSSGLGSGMGSAVDVFQEALDEIDRRSNLRETEYSLWEAGNARATEAEQIAEQIKLATDTIGFEQERLQVYSDKYDNALTKYGKGSAEEIEAKTSLMEAQIAVLNAQESLQDLQESYQLAMDLEDLEDLQRAADIAQAEVEFYEAMGDAADEGVKIAKQITATNQQILATSKETDAARKSWERARAQYGEASDEAADAYIEYLNKQTALQELQNEIVELQNDHFEATVTRRKEIAADRRQLEYDLWELSNPDATEAEKQLMQIQVLQGDYADATEKVDQARDAYSQAVLDYGEDSIKAQELWNEYLLAAKEALATQKEIDDLQNQALADNTDRFREMSKLIYGEQGQGLRDLGFSEQEIFDWAKGMTGWVEPAARAAQQEIKEQETEIAETTKESAINLAGMYVVTIQDGIMSKKPLIEMSGRELLNALSTGMVSEGSMEVLLETCQLIMDQSYEGMNTDSNLAMWFDTGDNIMAGLTEGVNAQGPVFIDAIVAWIEEALELARAAAGIHSPSRETLWIAEMLVRGGVVGIEKYGYLAVQAMGGLMEDIVDTARTSNTLEFAGSLIAGGIVDGMDNMTATVNQASTALIQRTIDAFNETLNGNQTFWTRLQEEYGLGRDDFSYEVVMEFNTDKAYSEMSDFEKALTDINRYAAEVDAYMPGGRRHKSYGSFDEWLEDNELGGKYAGLNANHAAAWDVYWSARQKYGEDAQETKEAEETLKYYASQMNGMMDAFRGEKEAYEAERRAAYEAYARIRAMVTSGVEDMKKRSQGGTSLSDATNNYVQNIYSTKPLSTLDVYRNTNKLLSSIS